MRVIDKITKQNTNVVILEAVLFMTIYSTISNGLANAILQEEPRYLVVAIVGWTVQMFCTVVIFALFVLAYKVVKNSVVLLKNRSRENVSKRNLKKESKKINQNKIKGDAYDTK